MPLTADQERAIRELGAEFWPDHGFALPEQDVLARRGEELFMVTAVGYHLEVVVVHSWPQGQVVMSAEGEHDPEDVIAGVPRPHQDVLPDPEQ